MLIPRELTESSEPQAFRGREKAFMAEGIPAVVREISEWDYDKFAHEEGLN